MIPARSNLILNAVFRLREFGVAIALIGVMMLFSSQTEAFFTLRNWQNLAIQVAILIIVGIGEAMVILTRNIDLSVGSIIGLTAYVCVTTLSDYNDLHWAIVTLIALGVGIGCGLINGLLVAVANIPAIIATLATLSIYRGLVFHFSDGRTITIYELSQTPLLSFSAEYYREIPYLIFVAAVVAVAGLIVLRWTHWGRDFYAIGSNPEAARYAGIPVIRRTILAFVISGGLAGLGGLLWVSRFAAVTPTSAQGFEFVAISAVVIGGVNLFGGSGTILGVVLGALLIKTIENGFTLLRMSEFWRLALQGFVILAAVAIDAFITNRLQDILQRRRRQEILAAKHEGAEL